MSDNVAKWQKSYFEKPMDALKRHMGSDESTIYQKRYPAFYKAGSPDRDQMHEATTISDSVRSRKYSGDDHEQAVKATNRDPNEEDK